VAQLRRKIDRIHDAGAELHVVGNGTPNFIEGFRDKTGFDGPIYVDPSRATYRALGLRRGMMLAARPRVLRDAVRAFRRGHRQTRTRGDNWQMGGTVVVTPDGELRYVHRADSPGDMPSSSDLVAALEA
jgi:hypothetical protein